jgi:hypothetical protein
MVPADLRPSSQVNARCLRPVLPGPLLLTLRARILNFAAIAFGNTDLRCVYGLGIQKKSIALE